MANTAFGESPVSVRLKINANLCQQENPLPGDGA